MADHTVTLIPLEAWELSSIEVTRTGRSVDIGLLCESLIYYDRVILNITSLPHLAALLTWFYRQGHLPTFLSLLDDGTITLHDFSFVSAAVQTAGGYTFLIMQD